MKLPRRGGKTDQVVDDDVNAAADAESLKPAEIQCLSPDALPGKSGVAVHDDGHDRRNAVFTRMDLLGAGATQRHRIYGFQVAGIGNQVHAQGLAVACLILTGSALVILDVAAAQDAARIHVLKTGQDVLRRNTDSESHHRETTPMTHGHNTCIGSQVSSGLQRHIEQWDQGSSALSGITLGAQVTGLQNLFEEIGFQKALREPLPFHSQGLRIFCLLLHPLAPLTLWNVHELHANAAAIKPAGLVGHSAFHAQLGESSAYWTAKGIQAGFQISPATKKIKNALPLQGLGFRARQFCALGAHFL